MTRRAKIYFFGAQVANLWEDENGFSFQYLPSYVEAALNGPISQTLPLQEEVSVDQQLFPFFDGLIPEGWLLDLAIESWKLNPRDRMGLLLACCKECIGAVSIVSEEEPS